MAHPQVGRERCQPQRSTQVRARTTLRCAERPARLSSGKAQTGRWGPAGDATGSAGLGLTPGVAGAGGKDVLYHCSNLLHLAIAPQRIDVTDTAMSVRIRSA